MKPSLILVSAVRILFPMILLFSVFVFWRGHHLPGGGFIGGLVAACAYILVALAEGAAPARRKLILKPTSWIGAGLFCAYFSGMVGWLLGHSDFMVGVWHEFAIIGGLGTPVLFDLGVFLLVLGFSTHVMLTLLEEVES